MSARTIAVLGAGSWGTALSMLLAKNGHAVRLWDHFPEQVETLRRLRVNTRFLPDFPLPPGVEPVADLAAAVDGADPVLIVVPSHAFGELLRRLSPLLDPTQRVMWATKGLVEGRLLHEVAGDLLGRRPVAAISGPSFAREVAAALPTAVTVASNDGTFAREVAHLLHNSRFRAYTSSDLVGVGLGGSVKNVLAVAAGIADGLGFGANGRSALITRGLAEMMRLGEAMGAERETFMGLAGVGDLVLTCTDNQSRNRRMGLALAEGFGQKEAQERIGQVVEGVRTAREVWTLASRHGVEMPITEQTYRVLYEDVTPRDAVHELLIRDQKPEF
ncbi:MAG: NAD(P)H-dependent glycerol-3-phosphate dehydrogenase [Gammaproteobacteria bacterium]